MKNIVFILNLKAIDEFGDRVSGAANRCTENWLYG
jgi:hypothetical protein